MKYEEKHEIFYNIFNEMNFYMGDDGSSKVYAEYIDLDGICCFRSVNDKKFSAFVNIKFRMLAPGEKEISFWPVLKEYIEETLYSENTVKILYRIGGTSTETAYFIADRKNTIFLINKKGYKGYSRLKRYKFLKSNNTIPQVYPKERNGLLEELRAYVNMDRDKFILFAVLLVQSFICTSSHFLMIISSEAGSGKSTLSKFIRQIIDPAKADISIVPESLEQLKNHLANNRLVILDNSQPLNTMQSDLLCSAITGAAIVKRELYTDNNEIVMNLHNIIVINGISAVPNRSDLLDRSVLFKLNRLSDNQRKSEEELNRDFKRSLPYILGAIFKTLSEYFKIKDSVEIKGSCRMYGAYSECYVISKVLGIEDEFLAAFDKNQKELQAAYSETNPLIQAISSYMDSLGKSQIKMSVSKWFDELLPYADKNTLPKSASAFSRKINAMEFDLMKAGFKILFSKGRTNTYLTIKKNERRNKK